MEPYAITIKIDKANSNLARLPLEAVFKAIIKAGIAAKVGSPIAGVAAFGKSALNFKWKEFDVSQKGFELIVYAIARASITQLQAHGVPLNNSHLKLLTQGTQNFMTTLLGDLEIELTPLLFEAPLDMPFLQVFKDAQGYPVWLQSLGLKDVAPQEIVRAFLAYFKQALIVEWCSNITYYQPIKALFDHPWAEQWEQDYQHYQYYKRLKELYHTPALGDENLPLSKIYIEPDFELYKHETYTGREEDLHTYIHQRLKNPKKERLLLLLGQPGQGKTSFCYRLIHDWLKHPPTEHSFYFIKLRDVYHHDRLIKEPFDTLSQHLQDEEDLEVDLKKCQQLVLVLDGLDELYMSHGLDRAALKSFYNTLQKRLVKHPQWIIILTSRHHYLEEKYLDTSHATVLKIATLTLEQQLCWLSIYKATYPKAILTKEKIITIDRKRASKHIQELIEQPILLHMVARSEIDLQTNTSKSNLYKTLFDTLIEKNTEEDRDERYQFLTQKEGRKQFRHWLQRIAFKIYQSDHEYVTRAKLQDLDLTASILKEMEATPSDGLKHLLVAFYFKKNHREEGALEFLHKSLQEYLTIEYLLKLLQEQLLDEHSNPKANYSNENVLSFFHQCFAKKGLKGNLSRLYLEQIKALPYRTKLALRQILKQALLHCLEHDFIYNYPSNEVQVPPTQQVIHVFEAYWNLLAHLNPKNNRDLWVTESKEQQEFCRLLRLLSPSVELSLVGINFRKANLSKVILRDADLEGADLRDADLEGADLTTVNMDGVDLREANIFYTSMKNVTLLGANIGDMVFSNTDSEGLFLSKANLKGAYFRGLPSIKANFSGSDLTWADFKSVDLRGSNLSKTTLFKTYFKYADLREVNFRGANLQKVIMINADLSGVNLKKVTLNQADLMQAKLKRADLRKADLREADLREANLTETDLRDVNLNGAKVNKLDFFQYILQQKCKGANELSTCYEVDPTPHEASWDINHPSLYYLIVPKK